MTTKELEAYVYEQHRQGMNDTQIAESLGLSVAALAEKLNKVEPLFKKLEMSKEAEKLTDMVINKEPVEEIAKEVEKSKEIIDKHKRKEQKPVVKEDTILIDE